MPAPLDTVESALQAARVYANDAIQSLGGEIITDTAVFTQTMVNSAWRRLQEFLADKRFSKLDSEVVFRNVPATVDTDPLSQVHINWDGYFSGAGFVNPPALPFDFITPWEMWERPSNTQQSMTEMDLIDGGLPSVPKASWNRQFDWRGDGIYMPGALVDTDIRIRYGAYLADFTGINWTALPIPIVRAQNALAYYICAAAGRARGDIDAATFDQLGQEAAMQIVNRDTAGVKELRKPSEVPPNKMADRFSQGAQ